MFREDLREKLNGAIEQKDTLNMVLDFAVEIHTKLLEEERRRWHKETYNEALQTVARIYGLAEEKYRAALVAMGGKE